jgi:hypothetical protein
MTSTLHENLSREHQVEGASDRGFGLTVGGIVLMIAVWRAVFGEFGWLEPLLAAIGGLLVGFGLFAPARLAPLNRLWTRLGVLLAKVVSPIGLGLIFALAIVPTGLIMRLLGKDLLGLRFQPNAASYWIRREPPGPDPITMPRQF